jgi:antitoxin CptB
VLARFSVADSGQIVTLTESEMQDVSSLSTDQQIRRLRWQCRRGMLELDHLLDRFLDLGYSALTEPERLTFRRLLGEQDTSLSDWFMARAQPPDLALGELVRRIVEVARERPTSLNAAPPDQRTPPGTAR